MSAKKTEGKKVKIVCYTDYLLEARKDKDVLSGKTTVWAKANELLYSENVVIDTIIKAGVQYQVCEA